MCKGFLAGRKGTAMGDRGCACRRPREIFWSCVSCGEVAATFPYAGPLWPDTCDQSVRQPGVIACQHADMGRPSRAMVISAGLAARQRNDRWHGSVEQGSDVAI